MNNNLNNHINIIGFARIIKGRIVPTIILLAMLFALVQPAIAADPNPGVAPPNSRPYGKTYGEWSAEWWQYVISFPAATSPWNDPTGANCGVGQSGPVFFLVNIYGFGDAVRNECVVPVGKSILFPITTLACAIPEDGTTVQEIQSFCSSLTDFIDEAQITVDGVPIVNILENYRFTSPIFSFTGAVDNPGEIDCSGREPGTCYEGYHTTGFSDGYWIMLRPLPPGNHVINIKGGISIWGLALDITYHLIVSPR